MKPREFSSTPGRVDGGFLPVTTGLLFFLVGAGVSAQPASFLHGVTTITGEATRLPGVAIVVTDLANGVVVARTESSAEGRFEIRGLPPGTYRLSASLSGFADRVSDPVALEASSDVEVNLGLQIAGVQETIEVTAPREAEAPLAIPQTGASVESVKGELADVAPVPGSDFQALLPLLPGVVRGPDGRINVKGGQATQSSLLVNSTTVTDPVTGDFGYTLPSDAVESVTLLPNPYAAEYGRFSAGVSAVSTRQGTDTWRFSFNNFLPRFRVRDGELRGLESFTPRLSFGGPLVPGRLYLAQTFRYRTVKTKVPVRPEIENDQRLQSFDSFTQLDLNLSARHRLTGTLSVFPSDLDFLYLNTFNPKEVTPSFEQRGWNAAISERATLSPSAVLETNVAAKRYNAHVFGQGEAPMVIQPEGNSGNFFNTQDRRTLTLELLQTLTVTRQGRGGEHLVKLGVDLFHSRFDGESESRLVEVRRQDGTLAERDEFGGPSFQKAASTDLALFAQDRWRVQERLLFEVGARVDRDGVLDRINVAPRLGFVATVLPQEKAALRGGVGLFYGQTPLNVAAFETYEARRVTTFAEDGTTPLGAPAVFTERRATGLETPGSLTWNLEYDQKVGERLLFKVSHLRRNGDHELVVNPVPGAFELSSAGRSRYWEVELTSRYAAKGSELLFTYVRSEARADLNALDRYFGNFRAPLLRANEFSLADTDTPHRFLARGTLALPDGWMVSPLLEVRTGFPYSLVNAEQQFVGSRNQGGRFPTFVALDLDVQRRVKIRKLNARIGFRVFHVLGNFAPRDVQRNIDSPSFGTFSNSIERAFRLNFQIG